MTDHVAQPAPATDQSAPGDKPGAGAGAGWVVLDNPWAVLLLIPMILGAIRTVAAVDMVAFMAALGLFAAWCILCGITYELRKAKQP
jgi:hypothetical protein